jgi:hypothetical protein
MPEFFDPRADLDYSDFQEVGEMIVAKPVPRGVDADYSGPYPRYEFAPGEKEAFQAVRDRLDRALQATGVVPSTPQEGSTPKTYEASLLKALAKHTSGRASRMQFSPQETPDGVITTLNRLDVVADALTEPARQGRLAHIKTTDQSGRTIHEYVGSKSEWMNQLKAPVLISPIFIDQVPQRA